MIRATAQRPSFPIILLWLWPIVGLAACSSYGTRTTGPDPDGPMVGAPDWVMEGCLAEDAYDPEKELCGVGSAAGSRNVSLARTAAINRARTQIEEQLKSRLRELLEASTPTPPQAKADVPGAESHIENVAFQITRLTIGASKLQDSWVAADGTLYTLVTLDEAGFTGRLAQTHTLSEEIREKVLQEADNLFAPAAPPEPAESEPPPDPDPLP